MQLTYMIAFFYFNRITTLSNEQRENDAVTAATAASDPPPKAYEALVVPYPVWAAIHKCGITRTSNKHRTISKGLLHDDFRTCIDLDETDLHRYFKTMALYKNVAAGQVIFTIPQRNAMMAFVQWAKDKIRTGEDPAMHKFEKKGIPKLLKATKTHTIYMVNFSSNMAKPRDFTKEV